MLKEFYGNVKDCKRGSTDSLDEPGKRVELNLAFTTYTESERSSTDELIIHFLRLYGHSTSISVESTDGADLNDSASFEFNRLSFPVTSFIKISSTVSCVIALLPKVTPGDFVYMYERK